MRVASRPLSTAQLGRFLTDGLLPLQPALPDAFHAEVFHQLQRLVGSGANPGNNLCAALPESAELLTDPVIRGALDSVLGDDWILHPHRAVNNNRSNSSVDTWHRETYGGSGFKLRSHRPRWLMLLYYPQETTTEMGPTGLVPRSHIFDEQPPGFRSRVLSATCATGGCYLIHYDIWHRRQESVVARDRFLVKFEMTRKRPPTGRRAGESAPDLASPVWEEHWAWLTGNEQPSVGGSVAARADALADPDEGAAHRAAYELARAGPGGVAALAGVLATGSGLVRRRAAYGLAAARSSIVGDLTEQFSGAAARDEEWRQLIAFALGENEWCGPGRSELLVRAAHDPAPCVRAEAVEALGVAGVDDPQAVEALARGLADENDEIRFRAALALARIGPPAAAAVPGLATALRDRNRYVQGFAVEALDSIGTPEARAVLVPFLKTARWCHHTSPQSLC